MSMTSASWAAGVNVIIALLDSGYVMHASACTWLERNFDQGWATGPPIPIPNHPSSWRPVTATASAAPRHWLAPGEALAPTLT